MSDETAAAVVDSATTQPAEPQTRDWTPKDLDQWNKTGEIPRLPKSQDSAPAPKDKAAPDSAPDQLAVNASESATDKQKPHLKTKEDTDKRFKELLDHNKTLQARLESLERGKPSETRETKQDSQPAAEVYKPLDEKEYYAANPKATYEDFVRAAARQEAKWEVRQEIAAERQRQASEAAQKDLNGRVDEAKKRYPDFDERVKPAVNAIANDAQIPFAVKAVMNDSPVFVDLMYVLSEPTSLADFIATAKANPAAAIRKLVLTEQLVQAELAKASGKASDKTEAGDGAKRDASGKFVSEKVEEKASEPKPRAPKPPAEVGGRGASSEDADVAAARSGNFSAFEAEQNRKARAALS